MSASRRWVPWACRRLCLRLPADGTAAGQDAPAWRRCQSFLFLGLGPAFRLGDLDPTNNILVGESRATSSWARDYGDVAPVGGIILGGHGHVIEVGVDVISAEE